MKSDFICRSLVFIFELKPSDASFKLTWKTLGHDWTAREEVTFLLICHFSDSNPCVFQDWDKPETIPDPDAKKPDDWDEDMDGEWEPAMITNPDYKVV